MTVTLILTTEEADWLAGVVEAERLRQLARQERGHARNVWRTLNDARRVAVAGEELIKARTEAQR